MVTPGGAVSTFATGFNIATGLAFDSSGNLYVANSTNNNDTSGYISKVTSGGVVSTFATGFNHPQGLAFDGSGNLYAGEYYTGTVSRVGQGGGTATLFATGLSGTESLAFAPATAVPEPASIVLVLIGGIPLLAWRSLSLRRPWRKQSMSR
jgi:DNA-binding beta-propeller fold protein YncE